MRGADGYNESLFSTVRLEEFVPQAHPLRQVRTLLNEALSKMDAKFSAMYEVDVKGDQPSIAPEKLMRAMLRQVLYSIRSERQLVEQISTICCSDGSSACRSRRRCGTTRCSARTGIGYGNSTR